MTEISNQNSQDHLYISEEVLRSSFFLSSSASLYDVGIFAIRASQLRYIETREISSLDEARDRDYPR